MSGKSDEAVALAAELVSDARTTLPKESLQLTQTLAAVGFGLLQCNAFDGAEALLRECLALRERLEADRWSTFNTRSMLGGALLGMKKHAEAEPLLLTGYEGMKQREKAIPIVGRDRLPEAADRLIALYTALDKPDEVKNWQEERAKYPAEVAPPPMLVK